MTQISSFQSSLHAQSAPQMNTGLPYAFCHVTDRKGWFRRPATGIYLATDWAKQDRNVMERNLLLLERGTERASKKDSKLFATQWGKPKGKCEAWLWL